MVGRRKRIREKMGRKARGLIGRKIKSYKKYTHQKVCDNSTVYKCEQKSVYGIS